METIALSSRTRRVVRLRRAGVVLAAGVLTVAGFGTTTAPAGATAPAVNTATVDPAAGGLFDLEAPDGYEFLPRLEDAILREINTYRQGLGLNPLGPMHDQGREVARLNSMWSAEVPFDIYDGHASINRVEDGAGGGWDANWLSGCQVTDWGEVFAGYGDSFARTVTNGSSQADIDRAADTLVGIWKQSPPHDAILRNPSMRTPMIGATSNPRINGMAGRQMLTATARFADCRATVPGLSGGPNRSGSEFHAPVILRNVVSGVAGRTIRARFTPTPGSGGTTMNHTMATGAQCCGWGPGGYGTADLAALPAATVPGVWHIGFGGEVAIPAGRYTAVVEDADRWTPGDVKPGSTVRFQSAVTVPADIVDPLLETTVEVSAVEQTWRVDPTVTRLIDGRVHVSADDRMTQRGPEAWTNQPGPGEDRDFEPRTGYIDSGGTTADYGLPLDQARTVDGQLWVPAEPPACGLMPGEMLHLCRVVYDTGSWQAPGWVRDGCDQSTWIRNGNSCTPTAPGPTPTPTGTPGPWVAGGCSESTWYAYLGSCTAPPIPPVAPLPGCTPQTCVGPGFDKPGNTVRPGTPAWFGPGRRKGRTWLRAVNLPADTTLVTARNGRTIGRLRFKRGRWVLRAKTRGLWKVTVTTPNGNHTLRWRIR